MPISPPPVSPGDVVRGVALAPREGGATGSLARLGVLSTSRTLPGAAHAAVMLTPGVPASADASAPSRTPDASNPGAAAPLEIDPPRVSRTSVGDPAFWPRMLELCTGNRRLRVVLESARLIEAKPDTCAVTIEVAGQMIQAARSYARDIEGLAMTIAGESVTLELRSPADEARPAAPPEARPPVQEHPLVKQAMELFKARLLSVQQRPPPNAGP